MSRVAVFPLIRALTAIGLFISVIAVANIALPSAAHADSCDPEDALFIQQDKSVHSYGTEANIYVRNRDLDSNCADRSAWSMVNVISRDYNNNAEAGWREEFGSPAVFYPRVCWQMGNIENCAYGNEISSGSWDAFKIASYPTGTNYFVGWIDKHDGNGWILISSAGPDMGYSNGISMAETGRHGQTTGALDHHKGLTFKDALSNWPDWAQQFQATAYGRYPDGVNGIPGYYYHKMSNTEYEVCQNGGTCPWQ